MQAHHEDRTPSGRVLRAFRHSRAGLPEQVFVATLVDSKERHGNVRNEDVAEARIELAEDPEAPGKLLVTVRGRKAGDVRVAVGAAAQGRAA